MDNQQLWNFECPDALQYFEKTSSKGVRGMGMDVTDFTELHSQHQLQQ
jgi:hypothetical protein